MTNGEFIKQQLQGLSLTDADLLLSGDGIDMGAELCDMDDTKRAMIPIIEWKVLTPEMKSVSENGFSVSWDTSKLLGLYKMLCRKYGVKMNADVVSALGLNTISDASGKW